MREIYNKVYRLLCLNIERANVFVKAVCEDADHCVGMKCRRHDRFYCQGFQPMDLDVICDFGRGRRIMALSLKVVPAQGG